MSRADSVYRPPQPHPHSHWARAALCQRGHPSCSAGEEHPTLPLTTPTRPLLNSTPHPPCVSPTPPITYPKVTSPRRKCVDHLHPPRPSGPAAGGEVWHARPSSGRPKVKTVSGPAPTWPRRAAQPQPAPDPVDDEWMSVSLERERGLETLEILSAGAAVGA